MYYVDYGHQFHQFQQNKQSSLILAELAEHKEDHHILCWKYRCWHGTGTEMWQDDTG